MASALSWCCVQHCCTRSRRSCRAAAACLAPWFFPRTSAIARRPSCHWPLLEQSKNRFHETNESTKVVVALTLMIFKAISSSFASSISPARFVCLRISLISSSYFMILCTGLMSKSQSWKNIECQTASHKLSVTRHSPRACVSTSVEFHRNTANAPPQCAPTPACSDNRRRTCAAYGHFVWWSRSIRRDFECSCGGFWGKYYGAMSRFR